MNDRITKLDKLDALREEQLKRKGDRASSTYYQQALVDLGLEHSTGRFASKPIVTGQTKAVEYPAASSPWSSSADPGIEMPTGVAIDQMEPVGTYEEIEKSIAEQGRPDADASRVDQQSLEADQSAGLPAELEVDQDTVTCPKQRSAGTDVASSTSIPSTKLAGDSARLTPTRAEAPLAQSRLASRRSPANPIDAPDDGLPDCPRRIDGTPMSTSHTIHRRKI